MLKLKCLIIILLLFVCSKSETINNDLSANQKPTFYLTVWNNNAIIYNYTLRHLTNELKKAQNGFFTITTIPPTQPADLINKNSINFIAWKHFELPTPEQKNQSYLLQLESPISILVPPPKEYLNSFRKIFTYVKSVADGKKVIHTPIPYNYHKIIRNYNIQDKKILITLVNTYFTGYQYDLRIKSVRWFLENHPDDILFYGKGWIQLKSNLSSEAQKAFDSQYKGYADDKIEVVSKSKFSLAYENFSYPDYVTEKIFDVMAAGSVPIYAGASNITDHVPSACFINYNDFKSHEELYHFLTNMDDATYQKYLNCIQKFMANPEQNPNHYKNVANKILKHLKKDIFSLF